MAKVVVIIARGNNLWHRDADVKQAGGDACEFLFLLFVMFNSLIQHYIHDEIGCSLSGISEKN